LTTIAFDLPPEERLELARRLVESVVTPDAVTADVTDAIRRIQDVATRRVQGLTEDEYRAALR
jgi:hypothetical protein